MTEVSPPPKGGPGSVRTFLWPPRIRSRRSSVVATLVGMALAVALIMVPYAYFSHRYDLIRVQGTSMTPTFQDGDVVILKTHEPPAEGDIMTFAIPPAWTAVWLGEPNPTFVKRVALVPGDELSWDGENWSRNGEVFSSVRTGTCPVKPMSYTLAEGEYFVTGDTHGKTLDSREAFCRGLPYLVTSSEVQSSGEVARVLR